MTDEQRPEPLDNAHPEMDAGGNLNDALAEASTLAQELLVQVGSAEEPAASPDGDPTSEERPASPETLEKELGELESLVDAASSQIDAPTEDAGNTSADSDKSDDLPVPVFMAEFTISVDEPGLEAEADSVTGSPTPPIS